MAETYDVASRLAQGRSAVDNVSQYVWAAHLTGYQDPDLTLHAGQVRDWYGTEDGLDLTALGADCAALDEVARLADAAAARQDEQRTVLVGAWQGGGGEAVREFLRRHGEASAHVATAARTAADALTGLRDALWSALDAKVAAAQSIEERAAGHRAEWLAAAQSVTTGAGDRVTASELIDQQVKPFVDNDVRGDWLGAMRAGAARAGEAYAQAHDRLTATPDAVFDVPGDFGPVPAGPGRPATAPAAFSPPVVAGAAPEWGAPAAVAPSAPAAPAAAAPVPAPAPAPGPVTTPASAPAEPLAAPPAMAGPAPMGGLPDLGSGFSGLGSQFADALGGLLGSGTDSGSGLDDGPPETPDLGEPDEPEEPDEPDDPGEDEPLDDKAKDEEPQDETDEASTEPADACPAPEDPAATDLPPADPEPDAAAATPVAPPVPEPSPPAPPVPPPPAEPLSARTPCEIAAEELPQVGG